jgi:hypothetical protein
MRRRSKVSDSHPRPVFGSKPLKLSPGDGVTDRSANASLFSAESLSSHAGAYSSERLFEGSNLKPTREESTIASMIEPHTRKQPIEAAVLASQTGYTRRTVTATVARLRRKHRLPIGSSRRRPRGFFLMRSEEDFEVTLRTYVSQIRSMVKTARRFAPPKRRSWLEERLARILQEAASLQSDVVRGGGKDSR